jgi:hypothetical protein
LLGASADGREVVVRVTGGIELAGVVAQDKQLGSKVKEARR